MITIVIAFNLLYCPSLITQSQCQYAEALGCAPTGFYTLGPEGFDGVCECRQREGESFYRCRFKPRRLFINRSGESQQIDTCEHVQKKLVCYEWQKCGWIPPGQAWIDLCQIQPPPPCIDPCGCFENGPKGECQALGPWRTNIRCNPEIPCGQE